MGVVFCEAHPCRDGRCTYLWSAGNEGIQKKMRSAIAGSIGSTIRNHSFVPSLPKVSEGQQSSWVLELAQSASSKSVECLSRRREFNLECSLNAKPKTLNPNPYCVKGSSGA